MTMTSIHSWNVIGSSYLPKELADAPVLVYPDDRFSEQRRDRQHLDRRADLLGGGGDCVPHDQLFHISFSQPPHRRAPPDRVGGPEQHPVRALLPPRRGPPGHRAPPRG